jgi:hypothetical protein
MVILIFDKQFVDDCITGLPIGDSLEMQWLHHDAHQMESGLLEKTPCLQQQFGVATQTNQDTVDIGGVPPHLRRKLTRHDGMACSPLMGFAQRLTDKYNRQDDSDELQDVWRNDVYTWRCSVRLDTFRP